MARAARRPSLAMPLVYVKLQPAFDKPGTGRVYGLCLPRSGDGQWDGVEVRCSRMQGGGFGVYPREKAGIRWFHSSGHCGSTCSS